MVIMIFFSIGENFYVWLGEFFMMNEWFGLCKVENFKNSDYWIKNCDWEKIIGVDCNDIEDDMLG